LIVNIVRKTALVRALVIVLLVASLAAPAFAGEAVTPAAVLQLESVRQATARYLDVAEAEADGYVDIGLFIPHMGWHYLKPELLDAEFEAETPELLVYADDPVAVRAAWWPSSTPFRWSCRSTPRWASPAMPTSGP
jgi:hypothetical protein